MRTMMFAAALAALVPLPAGATHWHATAGNARLVTYVDQDSLQAGGGKVTGDTLTIYREPVDQAIVGVKVHTEFACDDHYFRTIEFSYYDAAQKLLSTEPSDAPDERRTSDPGSISGVVMAFACSTGAGDSVDDPYADAKARFAAM